MFYTGLMDYLRIRIPNSVGFTKSIFGLEYIKILKIYDIVHEGEVMN